MYAIEQTIKNCVTGEICVHKLKKKYKSQAAAEKAARKCDWVVRPGGGEKTEESWGVVLPMCQ